MELTITICGEQIKKIIFTTNKEKKGQRMVTRKLVLINDGF